MSGRELPTENLGSHTHYTRLGTYQNPAEGQPAGSVIPRQDNTALADGARQTAARLEKRRAADTLEAIERCCSSPFVAALLRQVSSGY